MDEIRIENLGVYAYHGVYPEETKKGQPFYVNVTLYTDTRPAGLADELKLSTNYGEICHFITKWMKEHTYKLIETVAETLAMELLKSFSLIHSLDLEIRKPEAPIGLPFQSVSVKIHRAWHTAYIAMGSNMGDKEAYLQFGIEQLKKEETCIVEKVSTLIHTLPYGGVEQDDFLNGMIAIKTLLSPVELLKLLQTIESRAGRKREVHWGPRTLDLDIIFYDKLIMEQDSLIIPHIDLQNRDFVIGPMLELNPNFRHPILGKTMQELWNALELKATNQR